jgi:hypothetical protein
VEASDWIAVAALLVALGGYFLNRRAIRSEAADRKRALECGTTTRRMTSRSAGSRSGHELAQSGTERRAEHHDALTLARGTTR